MHSILLIARREYLEQIRGRAFKFSTVLLPFLLVLALGGSYLSRHSAVTGQHVTIAAENALLADNIRSQLLRDKNANFMVDTIAPATTQDRAELVKQIQDKSIEGFLWLESSPSGALTATYTSRATNDQMTMARLTEALNRGLINQRLTAGGMNSTEADTLLKEVPIDFHQMGKDGKSVQSDRMNALSKVSAMAFLIAMPIMLYGLDMARSIVEEKGSRIFEVMLAITKPDDLLAGKLLGVGAVGLTQIAIWVVAALALASSAQAGALLKGNFALHFSWAEGILFPVYFLLGFFLFSALFSGLAATCETAQELQMFMPLGAIPVWLSFGILPFLLNNPGSGWIVFLSLFPPTAPFVMIPRMGLEMPPLWQFAVSIGLLVLTIWAVLWFSSRLYRVGVLMYGKRATLPEIVRWLRYS